MGFMSPELPDVDPGTWQNLPRATRLQIVTRHWAEHGFGTPYPTPGALRAPLAAS